MDSSYLFRIDALLVIDATLKARSLQPVRCSQG